MTTGLPARVAICAVFVTAQLGTARADIPPPRGLPLAGAATDPVPTTEPSTDTTEPSTEPGTDCRQVAVIDLSEDESVRKLSGQLYTAINGSDVLKIPDKRGIDPWLFGKLYDEDAEPLEAAKRARDTAQALFDETKASDALAAARAGEAELALITPTTEAQALYADLALLEGLAALDQGHAQEANLALALTHRLDPSRQLDPARYPPDTVAAFTRAVATRPQLVTLEVKGTGRVWIDFVERGPAPGSFEGLEAGEHVVTLTGRERETRGKPVTLAASTTLSIPDAPASEELQIKRARFALSRAQAQGDVVARAGAMKQLAALLGVGDIVMLSKRADGQLQWETWRDRAPGFSAPKAYTTQKPDAMLEGIAPPRPPRPRFVAPPFVRPPIAVETRWYQEGWFQLSAAATVIAIVVGGITLGTRDHAIVWNGDIKVGE